MTLTAECDQHFSESCERHLDELDILYDVLMITP